VNLKVDRMMLNAIKISIKIIVLVIAVLCTGTSCASAKKNSVSTKKHIIQSKMQESLCDLSRLGKNKFFYSTYYKKKLARSIRKIGGK
jgi:hypothetical protein